MAVAKLVDRTRAVGGTDRQPAEGRLQRFQELLAQLAAGGNCQVGSVRYVWDAVEVGDLAMQEIAHEERGRQAHATEFLKAPHRTGATSHLACLTLSRSPAQRRARPPNAAQNPASLVAGNK